MIVWRFVYLPTSVFWANHSHATLRKMVRKMCMLDSPRHMHYHFSSNVPATKVEHITTNVQAKWNLFPTGFGNAPIRFWHGSAWAATARPRFPNHRHSSAPTRILQADLFLGFSRHVRMTNELLCMPFITCGWLATKQGGAGGLRMLWQ